MHTTNGWLQRAEHSGCIYVGTHPHPHVFHLLKNVTVVVNALIRSRRAGGLETRAVGRAFYSFIYFIAVVVVVGFLPHLRPAGAGAGAAAPSPLRPSPSASATVGSTRPRNCGEGVYRKDADRAVIVIGCKF